MPADTHAFTFRPHLDGLRAIAVLAVFVFHAVPSALPGGFIGVDIFFVLSGFLITSILLGHLENETYSLGDFYGRRIRRLLPASLALLLVVAVVSSLYAPLLELPARFREIRATVLYYANWNLIATSDDYFSEGFDASPLRHMWSLAIEEQFYFVWPIALAFLVRRLGRGRMLITTILLAATASAVWMAVLYSPATVSRVYYGTDTRVFQPLLGGLLAVILYDRSLALRSTRRIRFAAIAGVFSFGVLLGATRLFEGTGSAYFSGGAVIVALLTVGVIVDGEINPSSPLARVLSIPLLVKLGAISYGFYLWHWPIILWLKVPDGADFGERRLINLLQFLATLGAAVGSYYIIERPVRRPMVAVRATLAGGLVAMFIVIAAANVLLETPDQGLAGAATDRSFEPCPDDPHPCVKVEGPTADAPTVVLIGDSTSQAYDPALKALAARHGFRYVQAAVGGCPIGHRFIATGLEGELHKSSNFTCFEETPEIYERVVDEFDADLILATSFNETNQHVDADGVVVEAGTEKHLEQTESALRDSVSTLTTGGAEIVFIDILPPGPSIECLERDRENQGTCIRPVDDPSIEEPVNAVFEEIAADTERVAGTVSFRNQLCPGDECPLTVNGIVVRYDGGHLTGTQSRALAPGLDAQLRQIGVDLDDL